MSTIAAPDTRRILGVFAHPDDESFCMGGTLARYTAAGVEAMVVSATRGDAGQIRDARLATRRTLGAVREEELLAACATLGARHVRCLDYGDGTLAGVDQRQLAGDVVRIIREFRPHTVVTFGADGAYGHPDHIAISEATTTACQLAGDPASYPEQIAEGLAAHAPARLYHSHFPRTRLRLMDWLVEWQMTFQKRFRGSTDFVHALSLFAEESTTLRYADDHIDVRWYPAGFYIVEQGEPATALYLILSGNAEAVREEADGELRVLEQLTAGQFFGEIGLATGRRRGAHVIATDNVTCMVMSPGAPTSFAGRGEEARYNVASSAGDEDLAGATTCVDVSDFVETKVRAIAAHRTQYPIEPEMFPPKMLQAMLGREYFVRILPRPVLEAELLP